MSSKPRLLILADGEFGPMSSKTANSVIRYQPDRVVGVLDSRHAGTTVSDVLGFGGDIPVVGTMQEGLALAPEAVLIGIAPTGGALPRRWHTWLMEALAGRCDLYSGLHQFLADDPELRACAENHGAQIHDLRRPPPDLPIASGKARNVEPFVVLTVGTDCNVGKMTCQLQIVGGLDARGIRTRFVPTGQTGIALAGWGISVDAVVADFIGGAAERMVLEASENADVVLVEGQGSINHPGFSGVTLGLMHGACPDALLLCHVASREFVYQHRGERWLPIPPLPDYVALYEQLASAVHPSRVIGISMNTYDLDDEAARAACDAASHQTGLPCTDPVRYPDDPALIEAVLEARDRYLGDRRNR